MIVLFTDFGVRDPYVGQVKARLAEHAPAQQVVDLLHEVPDFNPHAGAHLLAAFASGFPPGSVFLAVVDPGVGTPRDAVVMMAGGRWFVGPDNGLLSVLAARSRDAAVYEITWRPRSMSRSFHGRDLFAPIAGRIAASGVAEDSIEPAVGLEVALDAADLGEVIYIDHYGNALTGLRGSAPDTERLLWIHERAVRFASVFAEAAPNEPIWYVNSIGLIEVAVNRGSAAKELGLRVGDPVQWSR